MIQLSAEKEAWHQEMMKKARLATPEDDCIKNGCTIFFPASNPKQKKRSTELKEPATER